MSEDVLEGLTQAQAILNEVAVDAQNAVEEIGDLEDRLELDVVACASSVRTLNMIMGNAPITQFNPNMALSLVTNQEKIFIEERNETFEAIRHKCLVEVIDGLCDMFVVQSGLEFVIGWITAEDIEAGLVTEDLAGHTGGVIHSEGVGVLCNVIRESVMNSFSVARIASEKLFIGELGVDPQTYMEATVEALKLVCENNLTKATKDFSIASDWYENFTKEELALGYTPAKSIVDGETWYFIKDGAGKFRKPYNYQGVDLSGVMSKLLSGVDLDLIPNQEEALKHFLKATKGV